jgi:hypothetical protein
LLRVEETGTGAIDEMTAPPEEEVDPELAADITPAGAGEADNLANDAEARPGGLSNAL